MNDLKKALSYFFIQRFFKSKNLFNFYFIFFGYYSRGNQYWYIIPFVNILVYPDTLNEKFYLINYLNLNFNLEDININLFFIDYSFIIFPKNYFFNYFK